MKKWILLVTTAFVLLSCEKEKQECPGAIEKTFVQSGFSRIKAGDNFTVTVIKGDSYSVKATGCQNDLADLNIFQSAGNTLEIAFTHFSPKRYRVDFTITMPVISSMLLSGNAEGSFTGFGAQSSVIRSILSGNAKATMNGTAINANVELSGNSVMNLSGTTLSLYGSVSGNATLNAFPVAATEVDILTSGNAKAFVSASEKLFVTASGQSEVRYKGDPADKNLEISGNARVIKE